MPTFKLRRWNRSRARKITRRKRGYRPFYRSKAKGSQLIVNRLPAKFHMPIPPRFRTKLSITDQGYQAGGGAGVASQMFGVYANRLTTPFNMGDSYTALPNPLVAVGTAMPNGFSNLCGPAGAGPYTNYKVFASKIIIRPTAEYPYDAFYLVCAPAVVANPPNEGVTSVYGGFSTLQQGPYSKMIIATASESRELTNYMDTSTIFGVKKSSVQDDKDFEGSTSTPPLNRWAWIIGMNQNDNAANASPISYSITVEYYVEFSNPPQAGLLDA